MGREVAKRGSKRLERTEVCGILDGSLRKQKAKKLKNVQHAFVIFSVNTLQHHVCGRTMCLANDTSVDAQFVPVSYFMRQTGFG